MDAGPFPGQPYNGIGANASLRIVPGAAIVGPPS